MLLIKWDNELFSVGVEFIDNQHQQLINYINDLSKAIEAYKESEIIDTLFEQLYDYTKYHFREEEKYLYRLKDNDVKLHQLQHKHFIEELDRLKESNYIKSSASYLLNFLADWLISHIQEEDKKFIEHA